MRTKMMQRATNGLAVANEALASILYAKVISATENPQGLRPLAGACSRRVYNSDGKAVAVVAAMCFSKFSVKMSLLSTGPQNSVSVIRTARPRQTMTDAISY
jgi:hypothetical protein